MHRRFSGPNFQLEEPEYFTNTYCPGKCWHLATDAMAAERGRTCHHFKNLLDAPKVFRLYWNRFGCKTSTKMHRRLAAKRWSRVHFAQQLYCSNQEQVSSWVCQLHWIQCKIWHYKHKVYLSTLLFTIKLIKLNRSCFSAVFFVSF